MRRSFLITALLALQAACAAEAIALVGAQDVPPDTVDRVQQLAARVGARPVAKIAFHSDGKGAVSGAYVTFADELLGDRDSYVLRRVCRIERGKGADPAAAAHDGEWVAFPPVIENVYRRFRIDGKVVIVAPDDGASYAETERALSAAAAAKLDLSRLWMISTDPGDTARVRTLRLSFAGEGDEDGGPVYAATPADAGGYTISEAGRWMR